MKKLYLSLALYLASYSTLAVVPVLDVKNLAQSTEQVMALVQQLTAMHQQLEMAQKQYAVTTGSRNLGEILYNQDLYKLLPDEYKSVYQSANSSNYGISGILAEIAASEELKGSVNEIQKNITMRSKQSAMTNKAVGLEAYKAAGQRLKQIEALMSKINETQDFKSINEVQARIAIEQTAIQNEITKLQMISQLQQAERQLIEEQKYEMSRRILDSNNTGMPRIK